jgi:hypothetical protein
MVCCLTMRMRAGEGHGGYKATYWPLILMACSAEGAVEPRAVLLRSSTLKELLWGTLEEMVGSVGKFREAGLDDGVRAQSLTHMVSLFG